MESKFATPEEISKGISAQSDVLYNLINAVLEEKMDISYMSTFLNLVNKTFQLQFNNIVVEYCLDLLQTDDKDKTQEIIKVFGEYKQLFPNWIEIEIHQVVSNITYLDI